MSGSAKTMAMTAVILAAAIGSSFAQSAQPAFAQSAVSGPVRRAIVHQNLLVCYTKLNKSTETGEEYALLEKITPNDALLHYNYGIYLYRLGDNSGAIAQYRKASDLDLANQDYHGMLGCMLARAKDYDEARSQLQMAGPKYKSQFETIKKYTDSLVQTKQHQQLMAGAKNSSSSPVADTKKKNENDE